MALPNTTLGFPKFDPIDIVGDALAAAHKDIDLSKLNRFLQNLVSLEQATPPVVTPPASTAKPSAQIIRATFANQPTGLWANAEGTLWSVTDYGHLLRWTGTGWEFADAMGGYIAGRVVAPDGDGWVLCDGSSTHYLHVVAGVASEMAFTTPNLTGNPLVPEMGKCLHWHSSVGDRAQLDNGEQRPNHGSRRPRRIGQCRCRDGSLTCTALLPAMTVLSTR